MAIATNINYFIIYIYIYKCDLYVFVLIIEQETIDFFNNEN